MIENYEPRPPQRLQGMKIRDEFMCPVTYELFRDPVVASDGHTYERLAIEKWLQNNNTSPLTGNVMNATLIPNLNISKLIQDMVEEGGAALYTRDDSDQSRLFDISAQKTLVMTCLGPPETDWNMRTFQVTPLGCIGGRKVTTIGSGKEPMLFHDHMISRKHFEVAYDNVGHHYTIRDLGSAGGTFIRVAYGKKKELITGNILMFGRHQFRVTIKSDLESLLDDDKNGMRSRSGSKNDKSSEMQLQDLRGPTAQILHVLESLNLENPQSKGVQSTLDDFRKAALKLCETTNNDVESVSHSIDEKLESKRKTSRDESDDSDVEEAAAKRKKSLKTQQRVCILECFAPEGSPLEGRKYFVGEDGATIGRKASHSIALCIPIDGSEKMTTLDSAVSSDHARIEVDRDSGSFFISDGTISKASTNGTWYRISNPHETSAPHELKAGMEILIGNVRFGIKERMTITEKNIVSK